MEENVALKPEKQKQFVKSIKGIKNLIKSSRVKKPDNDKPISSTISETKKVPRKSKGLVYLSHIPHGFYEEQMTNYFKQFGRVTNCRVIRSRQTGKSKGHAFIEFSDMKVAQIVAETMNNYLMGKRLLKAVYIEPSKQRRAFRKKWNIKDNPGATMKRSQKKAYNRDRNASEELTRARNILKNIEKTKKKLSEMGIDYSFFQPVDIPKQLMKTENQSDTEDETETKLKITKKNVVKSTSEENKPKKVESLGKYVRIRPSDESESDDEIDFDSDEFERIINNDDDEPTSNSDGDTERKVKVVKKRKFQKQNKKGIKSKVQMKRKK